MSGGTDRVDHHHRPTRAPLAPTGTLIPNSGRGGRRIGPLGRLAEARARSLVTRQTYFHLYKPGSLDDILGGVVYRFDISPTLLTIFLALIANPAVMVLVSMTLPARVNRATNLVVALPYIPVSVFNAAGASWDWASFYGLSIGIEVLILAFILRSAWTWPRTHSDAADVVAADRLQQQAQA